MKKVSLLIVIGTILGLSSCTSFSKHTELKTEMDTLSYLYGLSRTEGIMEHLVMSAGIDTSNLDAFLEGFREGAKNYGPRDIAYLEGVHIAHMINNQWVSAANKDLFLDEPGKTVNREALLAGFFYGVKNHGKVDLAEANVYSQMKMGEIKEASIQTKFEKDIAASEKFLVDNKNKEGVITTPSGLQYKIITEGKGDIPKMTETVRIIYKGMLVNGTVFDSSNGIPVPARVAGVMSGWSEALAMMPVGSKWEIYIPQQLGYGQDGSESIPPYATLIVEVELTEIISQ